MNCHQRRMGYVWKVQILKFTQLVHFCSLHFLYNRPNWRELICNYSSSWKWYADYSPSQLSKPSVSIADLQQSQPVWNYQDVWDSPTVCSLIRQMCLGALSFRNSANFLNIQPGCTHCNCEIEASKLPLPLWWGSESTQSMTRKVTGKTVIASFFYICYQNKPPPKKLTQTCTTIAGIIFLLYGATPAGCGWGVLMCGCGSVCFRLFFSLKHKERIISSRCTSLTGSMLLSLSALFNTLW